MSGRFKTLVCAVTLMVAAVAGIGAARAAAPFEITLAGPSSFVPGQALSGPFTGTLSAAGIGIPNQTIELSVDGQPIATGTTTVQGTYAFSVPPFTGINDRTARATAFGGTPLETSVDLLVPVVRYALTVTLSGAGTGSVASSPAGISCPTTCTGNFPATSQVTLTATPAPNSVFAGWSGACLGTGTCVVTMDEPKSVNASFAPITAPLTVQRVGSGTGVVTSTPGGINCAPDCSESYVLGTQVTLTAAPAGGSTFTGWSGGGCAGVGSCVVTINGPTNVQASFSLILYPLTVFRAGSGNGLVTSSPGGINCAPDCSESYPAGTLVTLTASASSGSFFAGWSGGGCSGTGACTVTMNAATSVTATFSPQSFVLTVNLGGTQNGTVTSSPGGINCSPQCSATYLSGTVVTLTANPDFFSSFSGWSGGGCSGTGTCTVVMNSNVFVTATFS